MDEREVIGAAVRCWRVERGWSQTRLAKTSKVSQQQVSKWENGRGVDIRELQRLLATLGRTLADVTVKLRPTATEVEAPPARSAFHGLLTEAAMEFAEELSERNPELARETLRGVLARRAGDLSLRGGE